MSTPPHLGIKPASSDTCLQCGESRAAVKANNLYCAIVDYWGECSEDWDKHRWADWTDRDLRTSRIHESLWPQCRRANIGELGLASAASVCIERGRHEPDKRITWTCVHCFANLDEVTPD